MISLIPTSSPKIALAFKTGPVWAWVSFAALLARLPLALLPGAGRDEALYYYWAYHPEPAYAPLMQYLVHFFTTLPLPGLVTLRLTPLLAGVGVIFLWDSVLQICRVHRRARWFLGVVVALSPWQTYVGAILHPDNLLLATVLGYVLFMLRGDHKIAAIAAGLGIWVKPSGLLLVPVALFNFLLNPGMIRRDAILNSLLVLLVILPVASAFNPHLVTAMAEFGKMDTAVSLPKGLLLQAAAIVLLGGPALVLAAWRGFRFYSGQMQWKFPWHLIALGITPGRLSLSMALVFAGAFGGAALLFGQVKGNWMLPAFVMLSSGSWQIGNDRRLKSGATLSAVMSVLMVLVLSYPVILQNIETNFPELKSSYGLQAGRREARVSATASWSDRVKEYQSLHTFAAEVLAAWQKRAGRDYPRWIVSDDYGLAAQLAFAWREKDVRLLIINDELFSHRLPDTNTMHLSGGGLILAVNHEFGDIYPRLADRDRLQTRPHPYSHKAVEIGFSSGKWH